MFHIYRYRKHKNIALHKYKALYFYIPKVACSSLKVVYSDLIGNQPPDKSAPWKLPHKRHYPYVKRKDIVKYENYFKFAFVRNPWDRLVSCYHNKIADTPLVTNQRLVSGIPRSFLMYMGRFKHQMSFDEFVKVVCDIPDEKSDDHFKPQCSFLSVNGKLVTDYVGRFETLQADVDYVHSVIGITGVTIPHMLQSKRKQYREYYNDTTRKLIAKRYEEDIDTFGYQF